MTAIDVCYCVLILSGAFALVSLGILLLRSSTTVKQVGNTVEMAQSTINKADKIMDDITYKLDLLNAPVETIARFFDPNRPKFNSFGFRVPVIGIPAFFPVTLRWGWSKRYNAGNIYQSLAITEIIW